MSESDSSIGQDRRRGLLLARSISPVRRRKAELFALFQNLSVHLFSLHARIGLGSAYSAIDVSAWGSQYLPSDRNPRGEAPRWW